MFEVFYNKMLGGEIHVDLWNRANGFQLSQTWSTRDCNNLGLLSSHCPLSPYVYCIISCPNHLWMSTQRPHSADRTAEAQRGETSAQSHTAVSDWGLEPRSVRLQNPGPHTWAADVQVWRGASCWLRAPCLVESGRGAGALAPPPSSNGFQMRSVL